MEEIKSKIGNMQAALNEVKQYKQMLAQVMPYLDKLDKKLENKQITREEHNAEVNRLFQGKPREQVIKHLKSYINLKLSEIENEAASISAMANAGEASIAIKKEEILLDAAKKQKYLNDISIDPDLLEDFVKRARKKKLSEVRVEYTVYKTTEYGIFANRLFGNASTFLAGKYPFIFTGLYQSLRMSGLKVISKTYISIIILNALIAFTIAWLLASLFWSHANIAAQILRGIGIGILAGAITAVLSYFYPGSVGKEKSSLIRNELPFAIIHMAAVAGSGAKPISIFSTILSTEEYPATKDEIKKIVNYVNVFGYDLSTALKAVARTTPSLQLKDLLQGIIHNIESGGDLQQFLSTVADEALNRYRLERQKYVEVIATYSDVYTALLIAAPLLFFVTLAIIQTMGGQVAGLPVSTIAIIGTYVAIPILNVGYYFFVDAVVPK